MVKIKRIIGSENITHVVRITVITHYITRNSHHLPVSLQECDAKEHWVCGSNGRSYRNHCELHRDACITKTKIHAEHKGTCLGNFSPILKGFLPTCRMIIHPCLFCL